MTISDFLTFSENLFAFSQLTRLFRSMFIKLLSSLIDLAKYDITIICEVMDSTELYDLIKVIDI